MPRSGRPSPSWGLAESVFWNCALLSMLLLIACYCYPHYVIGRGGAVTASAIGRQRASARQRPCDELYMVREGETLQSIMEKCNDPFLFEVNPHISGFDDAYPGLVLKISSAAASSADSSGGV